MKKKWKFQVEIHLALQDSVTVSGPIFMRLSFVG